MTHWMGEDYVCGVNVLAPQVTLNVYYSVKGMVSSLSVISEPFKV